MNYAELSVAQHQRAKEFSKAQTDAMVSYCGAERDLRESQAENAKLRELVRDMWPHVRHRSSMCAKCELPCDTSDECLLYEPMRKRMAELGVEVES